MPNVLLITADQWRGDCLSALGHPVVKTPTLDALAAEGTLFSQHFGQCTPCGPARASLLTGLYLMNHRSGRNGTPLDARHGNIALETRRAGYDPVLFGYTDTSADPRGLPADDPRLRSYEGVLPGFDARCRFANTHTAPWLPRLAAVGVEPEGNDPESVYRPAELAGEEAAEAARRGPTFAPARFPAEHSDTAFLNDQVIDYVTDMGDRPWFVHLSLLRPHPPWVAPAPYNALYHPDQVPPLPPVTDEPETTDSHPLIAFLRQRQAAKPGGFFEDGVPHALAEHEARQLRATYYGLMTEVDANLGRLLETLKALDQYERTLIVFTTDHGELLGQHGLYGKEGFHDPAYHLPLVIRDPRDNAVRGRHVDAFTEAVDIVPTILDWLGLDVPAPLDGASLLPFLAGRTPARWRREAFFEGDFRDVAGLSAETALGLSSDECCFAVLRGRRFKYVHFPTLPPVLVDLENDPDEIENLAVDGAYRDELLAAAQRLLGLRMVHAERTLANTELTPDHGAFTRTPPRRLAF